MVVLVYLRLLILINLSQSFLSDSRCLIVQALVARLTDGTGVGTNNGIISGVLVTVGDLARVVGIIGFSSSWLFIYSDWRNSGYLRCLMHGL